MSLISEEYRLYKIDCVDCGVVPISYDGDWQTHYNELLDETEKYCPCCNIQMDINFDDVLCESCFNEEEGTDVCSYY